MTPSQGIEPTADPCLCSQNQLILGVMGIDVALNDIKRLTPNYTVSVIHLSIPLLSLSCGHKPGSAVADGDSHSSVEYSEFRQSGKASRADDLGPGAGMGKLSVKGQTMSILGSANLNTHTQFCCCIEKTTRDKT